MKERIKNIMYGSLLLAGILAVAWVLYIYCGAVVSGIYAALSFTSFVCTAYGICHAPVMEEDESSTENK